MKKSPLLKVSVSTTAEADEAVADIVSEVFGQAACSHTDLRRGTTRVSVYLASSAGWSRPVESELRGRLDVLRQTGACFGSGAIRVERIRREDWAESWKRHFHPIAVGTALLVRPSWSRRRSRRGQAVVVLDPGLSFGTGQHPTTRFCLERLVAARGRGPGPTLLDVGTGSGILAIAAAKLGFLSVTAFDNDPDAVRIARRNAATNRVGATVRITRQDLAALKSRRAYDVVCANLIADLLLRENRRLGRLVRPGGTLIVAGVLRSEFGAVRESFESIGFALTRRRREGEWESGAFTAAG